VFVELEDSVRLCRVASVGEDGQALGRSHRVLAETGPDRSVPVLKEVNDDAQSVEILGKDGNTALLVAEHEYRSMLETAYLLRSAASVAAPRESIAEVRAGKASQHELLEPPE